MFVVENYNQDVQCKTLTHSADVFHEALKDGDRYYHVQNPNGADYDILYKGNTEWFGNLVPSYIGDMLPEYRAMQKRMLYYNRRGNPRKNDVIGNRPIKNMEDTTMSEEKKELKNEELCEEKKELSMEELEQVAGGSFVDPTAAKLPGSSNSWV